MQLLQLAAARARRVTLRTVADKRSESRQPSLTERADDGAVFASPPV